MTEIVRARAAEVGRALGAGHLALSDVVAEALARGIEPLDTDPVLVEMLEASVHANVTNIVHILTNDIPLAHLQPPTAAVEYALRLAQRDIPSNALVRAYHMGQNLVQQRCYRLIADQHLGAAETVELTEYVSTVLYRYIDWITAAVFEVYEDERRRWIGTQGTVLSSTVHNLLAAPEAGAATFERETGYRLDRVHRAIILWLTERASLELADLDRVARRVFAGIGSAGPALIAPVDASTLWAWVPLADRARGADAVAALRTASLPEGVRMAFGDAAPGTAGFCRSHEQSRAAFTVAHLPDSPTGQVTGFGDRGIALAAMLERDIEHTRPWVREVLGDLAEDSPSAASLRETPAVFLATGDSHVRTAERLSLHRNSVKYRIDKALATVGPDHDRLDVGLALTACEFLGPMVLIAR
ncbi:MULTISPECIES: PucR family transcriptional regulator [Gordonia]|uniref:Putative CdaR family transcriptional regulator n=1 Tax=Gordonia sihwensis NBRC 108236 TaxID=1223544 RepID=L7LJ44_9ACTN|nr:MULTISPECIES: helix-turn-helix domain-containing protein [Gordonia]AUH68852.1 PucR family transcriptional regulator [Gordonia sp. YC-JH1]GAC60112.1 putative CdaR family transcriptional regulator [Gordonia sihwensis NBRC 108236]